MRHFLETFVSIIEWLIRKRNPKLLVLKHPKRQNEIPSYDVLKATRKRPK